MPRATLPITLPMIFAADAMRCCRRFRRRYAMTRLMPPRVRLCRLYVMLSYAIYAAFDLLC